jgi:ATP/maltotriose-dependent transcriptional regulator MalT
MPELYGLFAELALAQGDLAQADALGRQSLELAREMEFALEEGHNLRIMGEIALARQDFDLAAQYLENSNSILEEAGDQYERAETQLSLAQLHVAQGRHGLADSALADCLETFKRLDAQMDLDKALKVQRSPG